MKNNKSEKQLQSERLELEKLIRDQKRDDSSDHYVYVSDFDRKKFGKLKYKIQQKKYLYNKHKKGDL